MYCLPPHFLKLATSGFYTGKVHVNEREKKIEMNNKKKQGME